MALAPWRVPDAPPGCPAVHTVDTTRMAWMLERMVKIKHPVLLVGESGTSKTATTQNFLKNLSEETNVSDTCIDPAWRWPRVSAFTAGQARSHPHACSTRYRAPGCVRGHRGGVRSPSCRFVDQAKGGAFRSPLRSALRWDSAAGAHGPTGTLHRVAVGSWCAHVLGAPRLEGPSEAVALQSPEHCSSTQTSPLATLLPEAWGPLISGLTPSGSLRSKARVPGHTGSGAALPFLLAVGPEEGSSACPWLVA